MGVRGRSQALSRALALAAWLSLAATPAAAAPSAHYYLSLGDSLAVGVQPDASGVDHPTDRGYVDVVARRIASAVRDLRVVKLGCAGETTASMIGPSDCRYAAGSQLAQAQAFLERHRGATRLVTVDIGDNDVEGCISSDGAIDTGCVADGMAAVRANLPRIASALRAAAGGRTPVVGLSDYDQFLALWLRGPAGRASARRSVAIVKQLNATVDAIYERAGVAVADAAPRFETGQLGRRVALPGHGRVPIAVARICRWTWACSPPPIGLNDHANDAGYGVLARAIEAALAKVAPRLVG